MDEETAYQNALDYLYSFVDYSLTRSFRFTPEKFNLDRMRALLVRLGNPEQAFKVIHVAGTKGKGSTAALITSGLRAAGHRIGLYTSPHLSDYAERIQVDGQNIPHAALADLVEEMKPHISEVAELTTFELTTALAFLYFQREGVSVGVIEVGLGGRLDATNVVEDPLVSVITSLSMDHMNVLGDTLPKIATEKAGIIKAGRPVVVAPQKEEAMLVLESIASERGAPLTQVGKDFFYTHGSHSLDGQNLLVWSADDQNRMNAHIEGKGLGDWQPVRLTIPLLGYHQIVNATTAYATLQVARQQGLVITDEAIRTGFARVAWSGRFEVLSRDPLLIVDSAHNPDSALKLRLALDDYLPGRPVVLVFGASEDKDLRGMFAELLPRIQQVIATQSVHPRAMETDLIVDMAHRFGCPAKSVMPLEDALATATSEAGRDAAVVVTGSLFVAAAARDVWRVRHSVSDR